MLFLSSHRCEINVRYKFRDKDRYIRNLSVLFSLLHQVEKLVLFTFKIRISRMSDIYLGNRWLSKIIIAGLNFLTFDFCENKRWQKKIHNNK